MGGHCEREIVLGSCDEQVFGPGVRKSGLDGAVVHGYRAAGEE